MEMLKITRWGVVSVVASILVACGGGSGGSSSNNSTSAAPETAVTETPSLTTTFSSNYIALPSAESIVSNLCTQESRTGGFSTRIATADLNSDGKQDIVSSYFCSYSSPGTSYSGPVPNTLIVFLSQADGSYALGNRQLFGTNIVDVGGFSNGFTVGDFNSDGKPDVGIGVSKEDTRAFEQPSTWDAPQVVLLSRPNGTYSVETLPVVAASGKVQAVDNEIGGVDFVYPAMAQDFATAFRWDQGSWRKISGYPRVNIGMTFFPRQNTTSGSTKVLTNSTEPSDGNASLQLQEKNNGTWSISSKYIFPSRQINVIGWNGQLVQSSLATVNDVQMTYATFENSCILKMSPFGSDDLAIAQIGGFVTPRDWDGSTLLDERTLNGISILVPFNASKTLSINPYLFDVQPSGQFTVFQCVDINKDGYTDVVINNQGYAYKLTVGGPVFYLNDKKGRLIKHSVVDLPRVPQSPNEWPDSNSLIQDMNGDGVPDLIYYSTLAMPNDSNISFRIYLGNKLVGQ